ncbi:helix-turn-helix domain-containing protein [Kribbella speibonae]|uniref:Transcriptional regulator n=1 Tax=Kribbella speibonae TaxID=1572660 RepID=A0ABY1ZTL3_9ACTN|nr:helix-turn-helix domain-containing protein [Kribbella speibonae]TCC16997.1 transcriptional regulator [Kribbella speibonae]
MYDERTREIALAAIAAGESLNSVSKRLGISRAALRDWRDCGERPARPSECPQGGSGSLDRPSYAHLLGLYLGDGCLSRHRRDVYALRIACDDIYPRLINEAESVVRAVHPSRPVHRVQAVGYTSVLSYWKHWPCLFPQHGPGPKHRRTITLANWQQEIVANDPELFLRGLFNSDGCRVANWTTRTVAGQPKRYDYPRYMFSNESPDIMQLCQSSLDQLQIPWRMPRPNALSVARQPAVAHLDTFIGPKS